MIEQACLANLEDNVLDPELRERLRPEYRAACKRLIISPDFYDAIQTPNAELVTEGIERVEPGGMRTKDGRVHELDVLVLATGFKADAFMRPMAVVGRDGHDARTGLGPAPGGVPLDLDPRLPELLHAERPERPGRQLLAHRGRRAPVRATSCSSSSGSAAGECREICATARRPGRVRGGAGEQASKNTVWVTGCRSWYLDDRGIPAVWPWPFDRFREVMKAPDPAAYEFA